MQQILSEIRDKFRTIRQNSVLLTRSQTFPLHLILRDVRSSEFTVLDGIDGSSHIRYESDIIIINYYRRILISWRYLD